MRYLCSNNYFADKLYETCFSEYIRKKYSRFGQVCNYLTLRPVTGDSLEGSSRSGLIAGRSNRELNPSKTNVSHSPVDHFGTLLIIEDISRERERAVLFHTSMLHSQSSQYTNFCIIVKLSR